MRTTLTLDDDVAIAIERLRRSRKASLKQIVNQVLREGLKQANARPKRGEPFQTRVVDLGEPLIPNVDNVAEVLDLVEGESYK